MSSERVFDERSPAEAPTAPEGRPLALAGTVALVTGSSRGIGRAIARRLGRDGARVVVHCRRRLAAAHEVAAEIAALGLAEEPLVLAADLRNPAEIDDLFRDIRQRCGRLDIFVSNAAMGGFGPTLSTRKHIWDLTMETSVRAFLLCTQEAVPLMKAGSRIVTISSTGSQRYVPNYGVMGAAKASLEALSRGLAVELGPRGISVNVVSGGLVETDTLRFIPGVEALLEKARTKTPMGRNGTPDDIANVVAWLCGPDSAWVCGQVIVADGGASLR
jgi:enoyl-[acyl-carrier protein] reductase III